MTSVNDLPPALRDVLIFLAKGYTNREIGGLVNRSPHTVHDHVKEIFRLLDVNTRAEAAVLAAKAGLV